MSARVGLSNGPGGDPARPECQGRQPEGAWKTTARDSLSRRNGKTHSAPGEARLSRSLPTPLRPKRRRIVPARRKSMRHDGLLSPDPRPPILAP